MKENAISKINKMGEVGGIITLVAKIFVILGLVLCLATTIGFAVLPEEFMQITVSGKAKIDMDVTSIGIPADEEIETFVMDQEALEEAGGYSSFDMNGAEYYVESMTVTEEGVQVETAADDFALSLHSLVWLMLTATVDLVLTLITLYFVGALCKAFRYCASPFEETVTKKMQNLAIALIPWAFFSSITEMVAQGCFTGKMELSVGLDLNMVLIIVLIFALVYIFKYGAVLQRESDETL